MIYTKYTHHRNVELLRAVDNNPQATDMERELAKRLERTMQDAEFVSPTRGHLKSDHARR